MMNDGFRAMLEVSRALGDRESVMSCADEAMRAAAGKFHERYFSRLREAADAYMDECRRQPPYEVMTLRQLKPFMPECHHEAIERAVEMFVLFDAVTRIAKESQESGMNIAPLLLLMSVMGPK